MNNLTDKIVAAFSEIETKGGNRQEIAQAVIKVVLEEQIAWTHTQDYNDFIRLVIRNFGLMNDIEVEL